MCWTFIELCQWLAKSLKAAQLLVAFLNVFSWTWFMGQLLQDEAWRKHIIHRNQEQFFEQNLPICDKTQSRLPCCSQRCRLTVGLVLGQGAHTPPAQALSQHSTHRGLPHSPIWGDLSKLVILSSPCDGCSVYMFKSFLVPATDLTTSGDTFGCSWSWHNFLWT